MAKNVERIKAEDDIRLMCAVGNAFSGDGKYIDRLKDAKGEVVEIEIDVSKNISMLKSMIRG